MSEITKSTYIIKILQLDASCWLLTHAAMIWWVLAYLL